MAPRARLNCPPFDPLDYYDAPSDLKPPSKLLNLPQELLAAIAAQVDHARKVDLRNLSLVCRRLRNVSQEALIRSVVVTGSCIHKLVPTLIARPDLAKRLTHVDFTGDYWIKVRNRIRRPPAPMDPEVYGEGRLYMPSQTKHYEAAVTEAFGADIVKGILQPVGRVYHLDYGAYLLAVAALLAKSPNLRELTLTTTALSKPLPPPPPRLQRLEDPPALGDTIERLLGKKTSIITVVDNTPKDSLLPRGDISMAVFTNLRRLNLPMNALFSGRTEFTDALVALPASIEQVQVNSCNKYLLELFLMFLQPKAEFPKLKRLDLYFECSLRSGIILAGQGDEGRLAGLEAAVQEVHRNGVVIRTFTLPDFRTSSSADEYLEADLPAELAAYVCLSAEEVSIATMKHVQFSEIVARDRRGAPRSRTAFEGLLFRRFWGMPIRLFTSPTFNPLAWSGVRMFNGPKGKGKNPNDRPPKSLNIVSKTEVQKPKREEKQVCPSVFAKTPTFDTAPRGSPTFDAAAWCKLEYFKASPTVESFPGRQVTTEKTRWIKKTVSTKEKTWEIIELTRTWKL